MSDSAETGALLNADQLVEYCKRIDEFVFVSRGNKIALSADGEEEETGARSEECMQNLYNLLDLERVILTNKIAKGNLEGNRVRVVSTVGKWNHGYHKDAVNYLRPHEALFLMEMCKLEVTFDSVPMSIEQGYAIFLDPENEVSFEDYLVYSYLSRAGYFVYVHNYDLDREKCETAKAKVINKEEEMIFSVLKEKLNLPVSADFIKQENELYEKIKKSMEVFYEQISGTHYEPTAETSNYKNLQASDEPPKKRHKNEPKEVEERSFIDILKDEVEYFSYENIFNKFSFIKRAECFEESERKLKFTFDIFLPRINFKKTEDLPNYRILIIKSTEKFPTNAELETLRRQQHYERPIIIAIVSDSMTLHFCICTF